MEMKFPQWRTKALTMSYDDGVLQDKRLIEIFKKYGIKATFNLNSGLMGKSYLHMGADHSHFTPDEINKIYSGFEVACHTKTHPCLPQLDRRDKLIEIAEDKQTLEALTNSSVYGFAYPSGAIDEQTIDLLNDVGIQYARTTVETEDFTIPENFLLWNGTCRHRNKKLFDLCKKFLENDDGIKLFYVWGHAYEFDIENNWNRIERFCEAVSNKQDVWYADNGTVAKYVKAYR